MIHNGEINTLRGNEKWMYARQSHFESELFGDDIKKFFLSFMMMAATRLNSTRRSNSSICPGAHYRMP